MSEGRSSARLLFEWDLTDLGDGDPVMRSFLGHLLGLTKSGVLHWDRIMVREAAPTSHDAIDIPGLIHFRTWISESFDRSILHVDLIVAAWSPAAIIRIEMDGERGGRSTHLVRRDVPAFRSLFGFLCVEDRDATRPELLAEAVGMLERRSKTT